MTYIYETIEEAYEASEAAASAWNDVCIRSTRMIHGQPYVGWTVWTGEVVLFFGIAKNS